MTEQELQELSRRAAGCLPKELGIGVAGYAHEYQDGELWLYEHTEACAEIMVWLPIAIAKRCLEQAALLVVGGMAPMPAFRVAVLKALIALKGE